MGNSQWAYCTLDYVEYSILCMAHVHGYKESQKQLDNFSFEKRENEIDTEKKEHSQRW